MMLIRECVRKYGRLPSFIVVDQGSDFESTYFEVVLVRLKVNKKVRPGSKPRFGSVIERIFKTTSEKFIYALAGNTQAYQNFRAVSPDVAPAKHAIWTFERLAVRLNEYFETVYHQLGHDTLGCTPEKMYLDGIALAGNRSHTLIPFDRDLMIMTCPSTAKGTARVTQHGVKIKYSFYRAPVLNLPGVKGSDVPVRYEPYNPGIAYAYVNSEWHELHSEYFYLFSQYTERAIKIAAEELNFQNRQRGKTQAINAEILATFLRTTDAEESLQKQQKRDAESREYRESLVSTRPTPSVIVNPEPVLLTQPKHNPQLLEDF